MTAKIPKVGGIPARLGFKYQDHVAAQLVINMIADPRISQVECETSDDITITWNVDGIETQEYIQIKTTEGDSKWGKGDIQYRTSPNLPTSLIEKSLICDQLAPNPIFRVVTKRDVKKELSCLCSPVNSHRPIEAIDVLAVKLAKKFKTRSANGNDLEYWTKNTYWQVTGEITAIESSNIVAITRLADNCGVIPPHSFVKEIYDELMGMVDRAAISKVPEEKVLSRSSALLWWNKKLDETDVAIRATSKPYRTRKEIFFTEVHRFSESEFQRYGFGYDAQFDFGQWRAEPLASYLADWLPELALQASELVQIPASQMREKLAASISKIEIHREISPKRLLGEMLLHVIIRHHFDSEPIACKLFHQTSSKKIVSGNAHIVFNNNREELWLGRATVTNAIDYPESLVEIRQRIENCLSPELLKLEREAIISLHEPQHLRSTEIERCLARYYPTEKLMEILCVPILLAYDSQVINQGFMPKYQEKLKDEITEIYNDILRELPPNHRRAKIQIFMVPTECVETLSSLFQQKFRSVN